MLSSALTERRQFLDTFEQAPARINVLDVYEAGPSWSKRDSLGPLPDP
jgi:hypothetical protein